VKQRLVEASLELLRDDEDAVVRAPERLRGPALREPFTPASVSGMSVPSSILPEKARVS